MQAGTSAGIHGCFRQKNGCNLGEDGGVLLMFFDLSPPEEVDGGASGERLLAVQFGDTLLNPHLDFG